MPRNGHRPHAPSRRAWSRRSRKSGASRYHHDTGRSRTLPTVSGRKPEGWTSPTWETKQNPLPSVTPGATRCPCWARTRRSWGASTVRTRKGNSEAASHSSTLSSTSGSTRSSASARPVGTRKNSVQVETRPSSSSTIAGSSATVRRDTVVPTWRPTSSEAAVRMASSVRRKWPGTPRNPSWVAGVAPSRLRCKVPAPASTARAKAPERSRPVTDGEKPTWTPVPEAWARRSKTSGRASGSPPVSTTTLVPMAAASSRRARPSSVVSSAGCRRGWASARQ